MQLLKVFLGLLLILGLLFVLTKNMEEVAVDLVLSQYETVPVAVVIIVALGVGILVGFSIALSSILTSKAETRAVRGENRKLSDEINSLRNIAIEEGLYEIDDGEE
ncbi:MAG: lipopolysaccharide assembly protein LapA domain-containing protein [Candidatus Marinimicrobia bacterium]|jgi:uncharacterized integral membrane protein|nr:hypothetical protein [Candidatus Neomarinimicrobiota bacterium]MDP6457659.1 lipopolysaccharide assembly protein LapA domain-containing protein [Candidatus Neomarinimicrobiota bacterium]MDP6593739.1 lipopolysaccharide assembly protein LapA domain-containing protein [Candidatus Neomarinimicrobiota bacterium]MDP6837181.1 lipopolysaccharide assembly protein LapA domain-containing protein [Candidatus Neomarinimicrobiota bacterium]MDP6967394.1 lipopolysaccharide assembly protein LapA domain-contai|tara:strand:- start:272 stop:589 length:318 start_codon:yes stop_codon:yes gene_type:complete